MAKSIIYSRVSTEEQAQGKSLDFQVERLKAICSAQGNEVVDIFIEPGVSAKKSANRPQLLAALSMAKKVLGPGDTFMTYDVSRFSRNHYEAIGMLIELRAKGIWFQDSNRIYTDDPNDMFAFIVHSGLAELDNSMKAKATKERMTSLAKSGQWLHAPSFGYRRGGDKGQSLSIHEAEAMLVRRFFARILRGEKPIEIATSVPDELAGAKRGGKVTLNRKLKFVLRVLDDIKCAGFMSTKLTNGIVKGDWEPIITFEDFEAAQSLLHGKQRVKVVKDDKFVLKSVLVCGSCDGKFTGEIVKKGKYSYYRCFSCRKEAIAADDAHVQFQTLLEQLSLPEDEIKMMKEELQEKVQAEIFEIKKQHYELETEILKQTSTLENLEDEILGNKHPELDRARLTSRIAILQKKIEHLQFQLRSLPRSEDFTLEDAFLVLDELLGDLPSAFETMSNELKSDFVFVLLPEKVVCKDKRLQTTQTTMFASASDDSAVLNAVWQPTGPLLQTPQSNQLDWFSRLARFVA